MSDLKVALVQTSQFWEDKNRNLLHFDQLLENQLNEKVDMLVFPEMFHTGFTMNAANLAETMTDSIAIDWLKEKAKHFECLTVASLIIKENGKFFNRMLAVQPSGSIQYYDKRHLFTLANEDKYYAAGNMNTIVEFRGWRILLQVCYDLRFPENSRNSVSLSGEFDFDLICYVANWPERRIAHWNVLLPARAIENQCCVVAVNRLGSDENALTYNGCSQAISALGEFCLHPIENLEIVKIISLSMDQLLETRSKLPFLKDKRPL